MEESGESRAVIADLARIEIGEALDDIAERHGLTTTERIDILADLLRRVANSALMRSWGLPEEEDEDEEDDWV